MALQMRNYLLLEYGIKRWTIFQIVKKELTQSGPISLVTLRYF